MTNRKKKKIYIAHSFSYLRSYWSKRTDLNRQPTLYKSVALPIELHLHNVPHKTRTCIQLNLRCLFKKRKETVSFHYTSSSVRVTDSVIFLMTISPSLSSSFFILHIYYIIFFIKNQKRFFNGDGVGFETHIIHRSFTLTKNYFSDLIPPRISGGGLP